MYHPNVIKLDEAATEFHRLNMLPQKNQALRLAGKYQEKLFEQSPFDKNIRFLHAQWVWALGHIGLLHQLIRWYRHTEPETILVLECEGANNPHFLAALSPFLKIVNKLPDVTKSAAMHNAIYFGCPDSRYDLAEFYKLVERECEGEWLLELSSAQKEVVQSMLDYLGIKRPYVALQPRSAAHDPERNVCAKEVCAALKRYPDHSVVITGLDKTDLPYASVQNLPDQHLASFLLSAACDQFVGSNSGAWVIPHAYQRPCHLMNDHLKTAWIYP